MKKIKGANFLFCFLVCILFSIKLFSQGTLTITNVPNPIIRGSSFTVTYTLVTTINGMRTWTLTPTCTACTGLPVLNPTGSQTTSNGTTQTRSWMVTFTATTNEGTPSLSVGGSISNTNGDNINATPVNSTLPIELTSFSGKRAGSTIELHWRTATERDNAYMEVQRSKDGKRFEALQQVLSKTGGNSYTPQDYTFSDEKPLAGVNYYRLRQVDFDGKEEYHKVISVLFQDKDFDQDITLFPTITKDQLNIALAQEADSDGELYISDMNGRVLLRQPFERGMQQYTWDLPPLAQGAYILSVKTGRELRSARFVKN